MPGIEPTPSESGCDWIWLPPLPTMLGGGVQYKNSTWGAQLNIKQFKLKYAKGGNGHTIAAAAIIA